MRQILWAVATLLAIVSSVSAGAARSKTQLLPNTTSRVDISYELRFWFMPFGHTNYHVTYENRAYQATSQFNTSGLVSVFWQAQINAGVSGWLSGHKLSPFIYESFSRRSSGKIQQVKLSFQQHGPPLLLANPPYNTKRYPVSAKEQEAGIDPMSAISFVLTGASATSEQPCGKIVHVFDGRRRYDIVFTYLHDEKSNHDRFPGAGPVHICALHYFQIAGFKPNLLRGKNHWPPIYARVADIARPTAPLGNYVIPLQIWADTEWGEVSAHLTNLRIDGRTMLKH